MNDDAPVSHSKPVPPPGTGTNDKMAPSLSAPDRFGAVVREMRGSTAQVSAFLSAAGLDDLPDIGALALREIASGRVSTAEMAAILGITEQEVKGTIEGAGR